MAAKAFVLESTFIAFEKAYKFAKSKTGKLIDRVTLIESMISENGTKHVAELFDTLEKVSTEEIRAKQVEEEQRNQLSYQQGRIETLLTESEEMLEDLFTDQDDS